ncbi:hypothetical protein [Methanobrevibacter sp.]
MINIIILQALIIFATVILAWAAIYTAESADAYRHISTNGNADSHFRSSHDLECMSDSSSPFYGMQYNYL